jgi:hypothetical protein
MPLASLATTGAPTWTPAPTSLVMLLASSRPAPSSPNVGLATGTGEAATKAMRLAKTKAFMTMVAVLVVCNEVDRILRGSGLELGEKSVETIVGMREWMMMLLDYVPRAASNFL